MEFTTPLGPIRDALAAVGHVAPAKPATPTHAGALLVVSDGQLHVVATDGDTTIAVRVAVTAATDGRALLLPRPLGGYLATLDPTAAVKVTLTDGQVQVDVAGQPPYRFRPLDGTFPVPAAGSAGTPADLTRLAAALAAVRHAVGKDHRGVLVTSDDHGLRLAATDGYRLARVVLPGAGFGTFRGVVTLPVLDQVARHPVTHVAVDARGSTLRFTGPDLTVSARLLDVAVPDIDGVCDGAPATAMTVDVASLRQALTRLAPVAGDAPLRVATAETTVTLTAANLELGSGSQTVALDRPAAEFEFAASLPYLLDAVAAHTADTVAFAWTSPLAPVFVTSAADGAQITTVVMPMRL